MADESLERITILLQARDKDVTRELQRVNRQIAKFAADAGKGTTAAARQIDSNLAKAGASALNFGKNFAIGLGVGAVSAIFAEAVGSVRDVIGELADLQDTADRIDMGVEEYQALQFGMKLAGVGTEEFSKALEKFNENVGDAARGQGKFGEVLARGGIQIRDAGNNIRPTSVLLKEFADLVKRAPEGERMSLLSDAFGKVGKSMVLAMKDGSAGIDEMMAKAVESGAVLDESVIAKAAELDDKFDVLTTRVGIFFKTMVVGAADGVASLLEVKSKLEEVFGTLDRAKSVFGEDVFNKLLIDPKVVEQNKQGIEDTRFAYEQLIDTANKAADAISAEVPHLLEIGADDAATSLSDMSDRLQQAVIDLDAGRISGQAFENILRDVSSEASMAMTVIESMNDIDLTDSISVVDALKGALDVLATHARATAAAVAAAVLSKAPATSLRHPGQSDTPPISPLAPLTSDRPGQRPMDLGDTSETGSGSGKSGGGGAKKQNDEQREAAKRFEQTRTEAEKYAAELLELNDLLDKGYINQDTFNRSLDMAKEKYLDVGGAAEFWKGINEDLKESILDLAADGVDSFDAIAKSIKRAAFEALLFGTGPMANLFGGGGTGGGLGAVVGGLLSFDGGGDTGMGARSGGLDGKGGFLAVMHPQESVIDRTKGQGGGGGVIELRVQSDPGVIVEIARNESGMAIRRAAPSLTRQAVGAVYDTNREIPLR